MNQKREAGLEVEALRRYRSPLSRVHRDEDRRRHSVSRVVGFAENKPPKEIGGVKRKDPVVDHGILSSAEVFDAQGSVAVEQVTVSPGRAGKHTDAKRVRCGCDLCGCIRKCNPKEEEGNERFRVRACHACIIKVRRSYCFSSELPPKSRNIIFATLFKRSMIFYNADSFLLDLNGSQVYRQI